MAKRLTRRALTERLPAWGVAVLESHHAPDWSMEKRSHPFLKVVYVLDGAGVVEIGKKPHPFTSGDLVVVPPGSDNRVVDEPGKPSSLYVLCVAPSLLAFDSRLATRLPRGRTARSTYLANRAEALLRRLLFLQAHGGPVVSIGMVSAALELIGLVVEPPSQSAGDADASRDEVRRYVERLDTHFYESTTIDDAARRLGLSRRRFTQLFREETGCGWLAYVHGRAVEHASRLLAETNAPIASVAFECGFGDLSTFYRRFKALRGVSPGEWRKAQSAE